MKKEDCFYLGRVAKKYSFKGEVLLKLDTDQPEIYENINAVLLDMGQDLIPFFIESSSLHKSDLLRVQFEDVDSEEQANAILRKDVYLPLDLLPKLEGDQFYFHEIIGFEVIDQQLGSIGLVASVNDSSAQALLVVHDADSEILIPAVDDFILKLDRKNKKILVSTPEGLIDMNRTQR